MLETSNPIILLCWTLGSTKMILIVFIYAYLLKVADIDEALRKIKQKIKVSKHYQVRLNSATNKKINYKHFYI